MNTFHKLSTALALAGLCAAAQADGTLVITPPTSTVDGGASFAVQVRGEGFTDNVVGGGFNLSFNPGVLRLTAVVIDTVEWEFISSPGTIDNVAGTLSDTYFNAFNDPLPTGNFPIATLTFSALAPGLSPLTLGASVDFPFANDLVEVINVTFRNGSVNVSAVPEPATWVSMALGLALLPLLRRRKRV